MPSTTSPSVALIRLCEGWACLRFSPHRHQVELYGDKVKRKVVKGNPQGGILSLFLWNCILNSLLLELRSRGFMFKPMPMIIVVVVVAHIYPPVTGQRQTLTY